MVWLFFSNKRDKRLQAQDSYEGLKRPSQDVLKSTLEKHLAYRNKQRGGVCANLALTDLSKQDFSGLDLSGANFSGANLSQARLSGATLTDANMYGANLEKADLVRSDMSRADMRGSILRNAKMNYAKLNKADLREGNLIRWQKGQTNWELKSGKAVIDMDMDNLATAHGADLSQAKVSPSFLRQTDLTGANLRGAELRFAQMTKANMTGVDLRDADLTGGQLQGVELRGANLLKARLIKAVMDEAKMIGTILDHEQLKEASTKNIELGQTLADLGLDLEAMLEKHAEWLNSDGRKGEQLNLAGIIVGKFDFSKRMLAGANFMGTKLAQAVFTDSSLILSDLSCADLRQADFRGADLRGVNFERASLSAASLSGARMNMMTLMGATQRECPVKLSASWADHCNFSGCDLRHALMTNADFSSCNFRNASMQSADLSGSNLSGSDMSESDMTLVKLVGTKIINVAGFKRSEEAGV